MAMNTETYEEFQRQLELQKEETKRTKTDGVKVKVDEDGTEYEWDETKKAWFPKLSVDIMKKFQENYATGEESSSQHPQTYVDPTTKVTFLWNSEKNRWEPKPAEDGKPCCYTHPNGSAYVWDVDTGKWELDPESSAQNQQNVTEDEDSPGKSSAEHTHTDPKTGVLYKWDQKRQLWVSDDGQIMYPATQNITGSTSYTDSKSGVIYNWDKEKNEWVADKKGSNSNKKKKEKKDDAKRKATQPTWFSVVEEKNTNVYVQGLPPDISLEEFDGIMTKCGIIMPNPHTGKPKLKLYKDAKGNMKGDGLCCYLKKESVDLALQLLDESMVRGGYKITVQKANFELKGSFDPSKKPKMLSKKEKSQIKKHQQKMLDWKLARKDDVKKSERVVIFKNMFDTKEFEEDATLIVEIRDDLRKECEKFGAVKKVIVFDRHPDGVCSVAFKDFDEASTCMEGMNGRWFAQRKVEVAAWDGVTDYQIEETDKEREERMENWEKFLKEDDSDEPVKEPPPLDEGPS